MVWHANRNGWSSLCLVGVHIFIICSLSPAFANQESTRLPWSFLEQHRTQILQLASDEEALAFFQSTTTIEAQDSRIHPKSQSAPTHLKLPAEIKEAITSYLGSLAATTHAKTFREILVKPTTAIPPPSDVIPGEAQRQWLMKYSPFQTLKTAIDLYAQVSAWSDTMASHPLLPPGDEFAKFASYYDQTYQDWDESPLSWTSIFQQHGQKGIEDRLLEYWQTSDHLANPHTSSLPIHDAYAQHYIEIRLLPMFRATLLTHTIQLEATAYATAWEAWRNIQQWQQREQTQLNITRLCGTWHWTVHNHQNHGDHKMTVTFSLPDPSSPSPIEPSTIEIHGDTVYLKWTFPQGVQEDSLLLSNYDTRLEGTFKNSLGPHGSISGKRLSACQS
jgi:hypothetical protein